MSKIPAELSDKIKKNIEEKLLPKKSYLLGKILLLHLITTLVTLSICPQFGFQVFKSDYNLMNLFMVWGKPFCDFACGVFFTATSMTSAHFLMSRDEIRALRFQKTLLVAFLLLISLGFFFIMSPDLFLQFTLLWLVGAILGIVFSLEISSRLLLKA